MSGSLNTSPIVPTINFNEIPPAGSLLVPGVYAEVAANYSNIGLLPFPARALILAQMNTTGGQAGSATPGNVYTIYRADQEQSLFGAGSQAAEMVAYWLGTNPGIPLDVIPAAPASGGTAATGTLTFGGSAKAVGTQPIGLCGNRITFTIQPTDTAAIMATNFIAAAQGIYNAQNLPVTLTQAAGMVTATANYTGAIGNELDLRVNPAQGDYTVPGVTIAVVDIGNATAGAGINNTALTAAINAIATTWYTDIMSGFTDSTSVTAIQAALLSRYSAMQHVDSHCYIGWEGSQGVLAGKLSGVNNQFLSVIGVTNPQDPTWRWSSALAGVAAAALVADPARQLRGLTLPNIIAPAIADRIYEPEQEALLAEGISTFDVAKNGSVQISRVVTTYTQSNLGVPDATWRDIMTAKVMTRIRWDWKNYLLLNYPRAKLSDDGSTAAEYDPSVVTPKRLQASWAARCKLYARAGWIENEDVTIAASVFARDPTDRNRVNSQRQLQIIGNNMVDAEQLLFAAQ